MTLDLTYETDQEPVEKQPGTGTTAELPFSVRETAELVIRKVLSDMNCPYEAFVSMSLVDDETIRELNSSARGIDAATDVLSFPAVAFESPCDYSIAEDDPTLFHPETGELMLGDIIISVPHVIRQAESYGHSRRREFAFLTAHSMLHLLGFDHMTEKEAAEMEYHQEAALKALSITREN